MYFFFIYLNEKEENSLDYLMRISIEGGEMNEFDFQRAYIKWKQEINRKFIQNTFKYLYDKIQCMDKVLGLN